MANHNNNNKKTDPVEPDVTSIKIPSLEQLKSQPITTSTVEGTREPKALNGAEMVELTIALLSTKLRSALSGHQDLNEAKSFSKAQFRFGFGLEILTYPYAENKGVKIHAEIAINPNDLPADAARILSGQNVWEQQVTASGEVMDALIPAPEALTNAVKAGYSLPKMETR